MVEVFILYILFEVIVIMDVGDMHCFYSSLNYTGKLCGGWMAQLLM